MPGLVISRKCHEKFQIGDDIIVTIVKASGGTARIAIEAPKDVRVMRLPKEAARNAAEVDGSTSPKEGMNRKPSHISNLKNEATEASHDAN